MTFGWLLIPAIIALAFYVARWASSGDRAIHDALREHTERSLEEVEPGEVARVSARVAPQDTDHHAPFSGTPCVAWCVQLQRRKTGLHGGPSGGTGWELAGESFDALDFVVRGGTEEAVVDSAEIEVALPLHEIPTEVSSTPSPPLRELLEEHGQSLGTRKLYRYRVKEGQLRPGDTISILARVEREPSGRLRLVAPDDRPLFIAARGRR